MSVQHAWRKHGLMALLPLLAATDFVENTVFTFSASHIAKGLHAGAHAFSAVLAAYATGTMLMIALQQMLSRHWGYRRYLTVALLLFSLGAVCSLFAHSLGELLACRVLQGFGGGALFTSSRILIVLLFAREERAQALRFYIGGLFGLTALGPVLAALVLDLRGWHAAFVVPLPMAVLGLVGVRMLLPSNLGRQTQPLRWDASPVLWFSTAVILVQWSLTEARSEFLTNPLRIALLVLLGAVLLWQFLVHQKHHEEPLIRWRELRHPGYLLGLLLYTLYYVISNANNYLFPVFAEQVLDQPLRTVGILSSLAGVAAWLMALLYVRFAKHVQRKRFLMVAGSLLFILSCLMFATLPATAKPIQVLPALAAKGIFSILVVLPLAGFTFRELDDQRFGHGYQSKNLLRHLAISVGTALSAIGLSWLQEGHSMALAASHAYLVMAGAGGLMLVCVLAQRRLT